MTVSDWIQIVVAGITGFGVLVALVFGVLSYRLSARTLSLMQKDRTVSYRQALYTTQVETYKEVATYLSDANDALVKAEYTVVHNFRWGSLSDNLFGNQAVDEVTEQRLSEQRARSSVDAVNEKLQAMLHQRRVWSAILPNRMIEQINVYVGEYEKVFERIRTYAVDRVSTSRDTYS